MTCGKPPVQEPQCRRNELTLLGERSNYQHDARASEETNAKHSLAHRAGMSRQFVPAALGLGFLGGQESFTRDGMNELQIVVLDPQQKTKLLVHQRAPVARWNLLISAVDQTISLQGRIQIVAGRIE